jgi:uncharacterized protein (DUF2141 family)
MERFLRIIDASWFPGILIALALLLFALFAFSPKQADNPKNANTGTLKVRVTGFRNNTGNVIVCLYKAGPFTDRQNIVDVREMSITGDTVIATFAGVPFREYAVFAMHDENKNRIPDISADNISIEGMGISNTNIVPAELLDFEKAKFAFNGKSGELTVPLEY